ncbi:MULTISPECIES: hypothetical protein [unclassified Methanosarcina]|uniref:hypothetical protein n=1 Tax=unclassified Methanosarcina TaxID=2644672 RepID=UPI000615D23B|nr:MULTISPECIES: hypothetical protein [unclassified Methanosarcina]AKB16924.1 hypothetical protein MSWHS_0061 [Methanosarcina sp. WWM596]AKB20329.1 hypothetical protein MSWH1_0058 [Methanosarcina sp. WH1]
MRVVVITKGITQVLQSVIESKQKVVGIVDCAPTNESNKLLRATGRFLTGIQYSFASNPLSLKLFSRKMQIPYYYLRKRESKDLEKWGRSVEPDLIYSYPPEYWEPNPLFWEYYGYIYDYILDPGVTVHCVDKEEDTGDIVCQERAFISSGEKLEETGQKLVSAGIKLLSETIEALESGSVGLKFSQLTLQYQGLEKSNLKNIIS